MESKPPEVGQGEVGGKKGCVAGDLTKSFAKKMKEKWRGKEELGQKGAWKQACREGESSSELSPGKGGFSGLRE